MPNRILKDSICTSENIDQLSAFHETFFYRLIVNCDDYGRMDARPKILSSRLFPLKDIKTAQIEEALRALISAELIFLYEVDGKPYIQMKTWERHQQIRAHKSKYPAPNEGNGIHMISDDIKCPRNPIQYESNTNTNTNTGKRTAVRFIPPTVDEVRAYIEENGLNIDPEYFVDYYATRDWKTKGGQKVKDWKACIRTWKKNDYSQGKTQGKTVIAQQYEQRDYSQQTNPDDVLDRIARMTG